MNARPALCVCMTWFHGGKIPQGDTIPQDLEEEGEEGEVLGLQNDDCRSRDSHIRCPLCSNHFPLQDVCA